jgi:hypothetical protein
MLDPEFSIGVLGGWRPFLELHTIEKLLKRIVYGRHYSRPSDHFFQDYRWEAWEHARDRETHLYLNSKANFVDTELFINTDTQGGENWIEHPDFRFPHDEGWDNPAPSKEVRR